MFFSKKSILLAALFFIILMPFPAMAKESALYLRVAINPGVYNSGLFSILLPPFEKKNRVTVELIPTDTEKALTLAENGEVDAVIINDPEQEIPFMEKGLGSDYKNFMQSYFVIVGPASDPAKIKGERANYAFYKIADSKATFIAARNKSDTGLREKALWESADVKKKGKWYVEAGKDTDETLVIADKIKGYTLSDRLSYAVIRDLISLVILVDGEEPNLRKVYTIMAVNPQRYPHVKYGAAMMLLEYLSSKSAQEKINGFNIYGEQIFYAGDETTQ